MELQGKKDPIGKLTRKKPKKNILQAKNSWLAVQRNKFLQ